MALPVTKCGALLLVGVALSSCASSGRPDPLALSDQGKRLFQAGPASSSDLDNAIRQAQGQRVAGDLDGATRTLSQLVLVAPDDPRVLGEYGKTLVAKGETDDAIAFLTQAIGLQPNDWMLYSAVGVAYDQRGNYTAAQAAYDRALALKPGEPSVLSNAGLSRLQAGDLEGAEKLLRAAAASGADNDRIARNLALLESLKDRKAAAAPRTDTPAETAKAAPAPEVPAKAPVAPVTQAALPAPAATVTPAAPAAPTGIAALAADPTVVMAPIPHDDADAKPAKKPAPKAAASASPQKLASESEPPIKLRPAQ